MKKKKKSAFRCGTFIYGKPALILFTIIVNNPGYSDELNENLLRLSSLYSQRNCDHTETGEIGEKGGMEGRGEGACVAKKVSLRE